MRRLRVLDRDPGLADRVGERRLPDAMAASGATVIDAPTGRWSADELLRQASGGYGLLLLEGLLIRRVEHGGHAGAELLSPGDLIGATDRDRDYGATLDFDVSWHVMQPSRLAVLDAGWARRMAAFPEVSIELAARARGRSTRLVGSMAIAQQRELETRLWMLFWQLANRFGHVYPDGVHVELPLTHELLADLVSARRPSVSAALGRLARAGRIRREGRTWILTGEPPAPAPCDDDVRDG